MLARKAFCSGPRIVTLGLAMFGASGCNAGPKPAPFTLPAATETAGPEVYQTDDNGAGTIGCRATGPEATIEGVVVVAPFGKGTDGARIDDGANKWVVSYRANGALRALHGARVEARGRPCTMQGQAVVGPHFGLDAIRRLP